LLTAEFWYRNKSEKDGFGGWCKSCYQEIKSIKAYHKEYRQTEKGKEAIKRALRKYGQTEKKQKTQKKICTI